MAGLRLLNGCPKTSRHLEKSQAEAGSPDTGAEARTMESRVFGSRPERFIFSVERELLRKLEAGASLTPAEMWLHSQPSACSPLTPGSWILATGKPQSTAFQLAMVKLALWLWRLGEMPASVVPKRSTE